MLFGCFVVGRRPEMKEPMDCIVIVIIEIDYGIQKHLAPPFRENVGYHERSRSCEALLKKNDTTIPTYLLLSLSYLRVPSVIEALTIYDSL